MVTTNLKQLSLSRGGGASQLIYVSLMAAGMLSRLKTSWSYTTRDRNAFRMWMSCRDTAEGGGIVRVSGWSGVVGMHRCRKTANSTACHWYMVRTTGIA